MVTKAGSRTKRTRQTKRAKKDVGKKEGNGKVCYLPTAVPSGSVGCITTIAVTDSRGLGGYCSRSRRSYSDSGMIG